MTAPLPTPAEVEGLRERHVPYAPFAPSDEVEFCLCCERRWPCDAARLLALADYRGQQGVTWQEELDKVRARLDAVLALCDEITDAAAYGHKVRHPATHGQRAYDVARIRGAATGEGATQVT